MVPASAALPASALQGVVFVVCFRLPVGLLILCAARAGAESPVVRVEVNPARVALVGSEARQSLLVQGTRQDGSLVDLTNSTKLTISDAGVAVATGQTIRAAGDGIASIRVEVAGQIVVVPVRVSGFARPREFHFENDIEPLLGRFGCNSSGCHGKAEGQNGFKLSVFGYDPPADYSALVKEARGRRIFASAPERSLFLTKAAGQVPHGGGTRIAAGMDAYETIRGWIAAGATMGAADVPTVERIRVEPAERILAMHAGQQLRVTARYSDGREVDVTPMARFQSNNPAIAGVSADGLVLAADRPGEATILASFANEVAVFRALVPRPGTSAFPNLPPKNFIDPLVVAKLRKLNLAPSGPADDWTYLRRVYLDVIGTLPTADESRRFLADGAPDKRARLIDSLLDRPEYSDYWALKWADLLRVDRQALGHRRAYAYYRWIRASVADNVPFDRFARDIVTAEGPLEDSPAGSFYSAAAKPGDAANTLSQVFLGVRIACAECHHHPADKWGQADYYGMAAFFTPVAARQVGSVDAIVVNGSATSTHPRTGAAIGATPLGMKFEAKPGDRRPDLAAWMTSSDNPFFARNLANRLWANFLGRGLVEPVDDVRATNPPSNVALLDALAADVVASKFNVKAVIRTICASRTYQTAATPNETNARDEQNYSRALFKRPDAEVLLDMLCQATGVTEKFTGTPVGTRAIQLWDSKVRHYFLEQFGRPVRATACTCERNAEPTIAHVLHFLNSDTVNDKLRHEGGNIARWCREYADDGRLLDEMYLTFLARLPTPKDREMVTVHLKKSKTRRDGFEDVAWAILNSKEFAFNH